MYRDADPVLRREWSERLAGFRAAERAIPRRITRVLARRTGRLVAGVTTLVLLVAMGILAQLKGKLFVLGWTAWPSGLALYSPFVFVGTWLVGRRSARFLLAAELAWRRRATGDVHADLDRIAVQPADVARAAAARLERASTALWVASVLVVLPMAVGVFGAGAAYLDFDDPLRIATSTFTPAILGTYVAAWICARDLRSGRWLVVAALPLACGAWRFPGVAIVLSLLELIFVPLVTANAARVERSERMDLI